MQFCRLESSTKRQGIKLMTNKQNIDFDIIHTCEPKAKPKVQLKHLKTVKGHWKRRKYSHADFTDKAKSRQFARLVDNRNKKCVIH